MSAKEWLIAWRNLGRNRKRNLTTLIAVMFAFSGIVLFWGYVIQAERFLRAYSVYVNHVGEVIVYKKGGLAHHLAKPRQFTFNPQEVAAVERAIARVDGVEHVGRYLHGMALLSNGCGAFPVEILGVEPERERWVRSLPFVREASPEFARLAHGQGLGDFTQRGTLTPVLVTPELARKAGKIRVWSEIPEVRTAPLLPECGNGEKTRESLAADANVQLAAFTLSGSFSAVDAEIVGWRKASLSWNRETETLLPLEATQRLFDTEHLSHLNAFLRSGTSAAKVAGVLRTRLKEAGVDADVYTYQSEDVNGFYAGNMNILYAMSVFFLILVTAAAVLSTMTSVVMTILERMREMGFLRSLGYTPLRIARLHTIEGAYVSLGGILCGVVLCAGVAALTRSADVRLAPPGLQGTVRFELVLEPAVLAGTAVFVLLVSVLTCACTAWRHARRPVLDLLTTTHT